MKKILSVLSIGLLVFSQSLHAHSKKRHDIHIVSVVPVIHSISQELLNGTPVEVHYLPPKRLPIGRISHWLGHKSQSRIEDLPEISALVTIESVWPSFSLLKHLRGNNIRVVAIDGATEILAGGAQVRLNDNDLSNQTAFWMAPDNLIVMSQIIARDMQQLWPELSVVIRNNQQKLEKSIKTFALQLDQLLLDKGVDEVCLQESTLMPLAQATFLPVEFKDCADGSLKISLLKKKVPPAAGNWQVDGLIKPINTNLSVWLSANLRRLEKALEAHP